MKKIFKLSIVLLICIAFALLAVGCNNVEEDVIPEPESDLKIVFLGDSIAEGIIGISPEEERVNYAFYGILGQINGYEYINRAISGNQTKELLQYVNTPESDANIPISHIRTADMICISITGNDLLFHNFPCMFYELVAKETLEPLGKNYVEDERVQACYLYNKYATIDVLDGTIKDVEPGDGIQALEDCKVRATNNITATYNRLRELNPTAKIFFQNVYNPVTANSALIPEDLVNALVELDPSYDFESETGIEKYRRKGAEILGCMSDVLENLAKENENVYFVDVASKFDEVYRADKEKGAELIFVDGVHPSNKGHAMIARIYQDLFIQMDLAESVRSIAKYKSIRKEQFDKLYLDAYKSTFASNDAFNTAYAKFTSELKAANSMAKVDEIYFGATDALTAKLSSDPVTNKKTNGKYVQEEEVYELDSIELAKADQDTVDLINGFLPLIKNLYMSEKSLTLTTDGVMEIRLGVKADKLLSYVSGLMENINGKVFGGLSDVVYKYEDEEPIVLMLAGAMDYYHTLDAYAEELFPGIGFSKGTLGKNFSMLYNSLGVKIEGIEILTSEKYVDTVGLPKHKGVDGEIDESTINKEYDSYVDYLIAYISRYTLMKDADGREIYVDRFPDNLSEQLMKLTNITIVIKSVYSLETVVDADGKEYDAIFCGQYYNKTTPFLILTRDNEEETISFANQMVGVKVTFVK